MTYLRQKTSQHYFSYLTSPHMEWHDLKASQTLHRAVINWKFLQWSLLPNEILGSKNVHTIVRWYWDQQLKANLLWAEVAVRLSRALADLVVDGDDISLEVVCAAEAVGRQERFHSRCFNLQWFKRLLCSRRLLDEHLIVLLTSKWKAKLESVWSLKKCQMLNKSCPKMISLEQWKILIPLQKLPKNVGYLDKIIVATGFEKLPKVQ